MTDDSKRIEAAAESALYKFTAGSTLYEENHFREGFKAGIAWRDRPGNESDEVRALADALELAQKHLPHLDALPRKTETEVGAAVKAVDKALRQWRARKGSNGNDNR